MLVCDGRCWSVLVWSVLVVAGRAGKSVRVDAGGSLVVNAGQCWSVDAGQYWTVLVGWYK